MISRKNKSVIKKLPTKLFFFSIFLNITKTWKHICFYTKLLMPMFVHVLLHTLYLQTAITIIVQGIVIGKTEKEEYKEDN